MSIRHVVVVMLENRSYDNVLGWLYNPSNPAPYDKAPVGQAFLDGLTGQESNPNPSYDPKKPESPSNEPTIPVQNFGVSTYNGLPYPATCIPMDDPGEYFKDIAQQINGGDLPDANPYGDYPKGAPALMQGFTTNYAHLDGFDQQAPPTPAWIMNYFTPSQVPVSAFLARHYAVCDRWFASVPAQTFTNRTFALTAAPGVHGGSGGFSFVDDSQWADSLTGMPSLFEVLDRVKPAPAGAHWKVYFHDYSITCMTVPYVKERGEGKPKNNVNVSTFDSSDWGDLTPAQLAGKLPPTFVDDVAKGTLPPFAFLEPRYGTRNKPPKVTPPPNRLPANSNHPGAGYGKVNVYAPPIDVSSGELFLLQVYNTLVSNPKVWAETLLIVTYDEHGGLFDHVPPPPATPPGPSVPEAHCDTDSAADKFTFNVLGCRVPAIVISPYINPGSSIPEHFDHTSIIKT
ncbi:MAG TPA: alkaline phosphatase family protein, partial [Thermoanaerobaculia bacterium]